MLQAYACITHRTLTHNKGSHAHSLWQLAWARSSRLCVKPWATVVARTVAWAALAVAVFARLTALGAIVAVRFAAEFIGAAMDGAYCSAASAAAAIHLVATWAEMKVAAAKASAAKPVAATVAVAQPSSMYLAASMGVGVETVIASWRCGRLVGCSWMFLESLCSIHPEHRRTKAPQRLAFLLVDFHLVQQRERFSQSVSQSADID